MKTHSKILLAMMVKWPEPGRVKTRLASGVGEEDAADLYRAMVDDLVSEFRENGHFDFTIHVSPQDRRQDFSLWLGPHLPIYPQRGDDLGARMSHLFETEFGRGYERVICIGSDLPTLLKGDVIRASEALHHWDVVLGPSLDGGYYLIGMKETHRELFTDMIWSRDTVLHETRNRIERLDLTWKCFDTKRDIDDSGDARVLWKFLQESGDKAMCSRSRAVLSRIFHKEIEDG